MEPRGSSTPAPAPGSGEISSPQTIPETKMTIDQADTNNGNSETAPSDEIEDDGDPRSQLEQFNWDDLDQRFQNMAQACDHEEEKVWDEFSQLMEFFKIWAATTQSHEVDRSMKRLATRMYLIQKSEEQVEHKRQHYVRVVEAFENALKLLQGG